MATLCDASKGIIIVFLMGIFIFLFLITIYWKQKQLKIYSIIREKFWLGIFEISKDPQNNVVNP
jgi:hypothetical protein